MFANINFFVSFMEFYWKVFVDVLLALNWKLLHLHFYMHNLWDKTNFHPTELTAEPQLKLLIISATPNIIDIKN